jgi:hypothetical protein
MHKTGMSAHVVNVGDGWTNVHFTLHGGGILDLSSGDGRELRDTLADHFSQIKGVSLVNVTDSGVSVEHTDSAMAMVRAAVQTACGLAGILVA